MLVQLLSFTPLLALLVVASVCDLRTRRIPNWLTLPLALGGIAHSILWPESIGLGRSLAGLGVGLMVPFLLFAVRAMGAGDVKLFAAVGAWVGPGPVAWVLALTAILGGVMILAQAMWQRRTVLLLQSTGAVALDVMQVRSAGPKHLLDASQRPGVVRHTLPYGVPIALATAAVIFRLSGLP